MDRFLFYDVKQRTRLALPKSIPDPRDALALCLPCKPVGGLWERAGAAGSIDCHSKEDGRGTRVGHAPKVHAKEKKTSAPDRSACRSACREGAGQYARQGALEDVKQKCPSPCLQNCKEHATAPGRSACKSARFMGLACCLHQGQSMVNAEIMACLCWASDASSQRVWQAHGFR